MGPSAHPMGVTCPLCDSGGEVLYRAMADAMRPTPGKWDLMRCRSGECGLIFLRPKPDASILKEAYRDYYTHDARPEAWGGGRGEGKFRRFTGRAGLEYLGRRYGYPVKPVRGPGRLLACAAGALNARKRAEWDTSVMYLPAHSGGRLLDVGCGSGDFLVQMRDRGWEVHGCDPDESAVERARARVLDVDVGTGESLGHPDDHFDAVTLSHVIEHVLDPKGTLRQCGRVLKKGGVLVLTTPNTASLGHRAFGKCWMHLDVPRHVHLFNARSLGKLARECGFEKGRCFSSVYGADLQHYFSRMIAREGRNSMIVPPARRLVASRLFGFVESLCLRIDRSLGENLVLMAIK